MVNVTQDRFFFFIFAATSRSNDVLWQKIIAPSEKPSFLYVNHQFLMTSSIPFSAWKNIAKLLAIKRRPPSGSHLFHQSIGTFCLKNCAKFCFLFFSTAVLWPNVLSVRLAVLNLVHSYKCRVLWGTFVAGPCLIIFENRKEYNCRSSLKKSKASYVWSTN